MALTEMQIRQAKPKDKNYKLYDEKGLLLLIKTNGARYWRFKYRFTGKEKLLALGVYPEVSLKKARRKTVDARRQLENDIDPGFLKKTKKMTMAEAAANSFQEIALEWYAKESPNWSEAHRKKQKWLLEKNLLPYLGINPIKDITPPVLLAALKKIESRGALETTRRAKQVAGQVFRYAAVTGRAERDPSADIKGALKTPQTIHFSAITDPVRVGQLLRAIYDYQGSSTVQAALKLAPLIFVRPGELRQMEWSEVDLEKAEWYLPAEKMKMKEAHIVPLSTQAVKIIASQHELLGLGRYVFPGERTRKRPMSDNALNAALRRMDFSKEEMTAHGFRAMARTLLDEQLEFEHHLIEHQLAHEVKDPLGRAYNRTKHLPQRRKMMQVWADYLDSLKAGAEIIPIRNKCISSD